MSVTNGHRKLERPIGRKTSSTDLLRDSVRELNETMKQLIAVMQQQASVSKVKR